jgi:hypothetical protein
MAMAIGVFIVVVVARGKLLLSIGCGVPHTYV